MELTLDELARLVQGTVRGDGSTRIRGINGLREAEDGEIAFLANRRYEALLGSTRASAVIVSEGVSTSIPAIEVKNPDLAFARVAERLNGRTAPLAPGIHPSAAVSPEATLGTNVAVGAHAVVEAGAVIGDGTHIHPQVYVGAEARLGAGCLLYPQVVIREQCLLGDRVIIHSGAVVGSDGFGFTTDNGVHHKIPQIGIVVVEDDVEIGANTAIDRARFGRTLIGRGSKIDNLVQIAHNVVVGPGSLIAAQAGISGSTKLGRFVVLAGQVGLAGHLELGDGVVVTAQSGVGKNIAPGTQVTGHHAVESKKYFRQQAALGHLPAALREIRKLRKEIEELRGRLSGGGSGGSAS